ncbi:oxidoreductase [Pollutimonas subterranea]|uniref:Oxidoreductase n=1 Tax=Pollutimonas subterranea TaxID=2045210 RepID=A0A2N4U676_9BURK|nr:NAD(P)/FAD-dependent oxidoreductase [Pollutimonas subterranea]PLC50503.1 oxidoreductase [Pollutimonas subterranea]
MSPNSTIYDALIVGAGPAGVSCAVWLKRLGFVPAVVESKEKVGGLCRENPFLDEWNVALPGMMGHQVADNLALSLQRAGVPLWLSCAARYVEPAGHGFSVTCEGIDAPLRARHVVLATGVRARGLSAGATTAGYKPGSASALSSLGILVGPGAHVVAQDFRGKRVAILGGGDNAFENALYASDHGAAKVHVYARTIRAQRQFLRKIQPADIRLGSYRVDTVTRTVNDEPYDLIMVFYGWEPCVGFVETLGLHRSAQGFIATDMQTAQASFPGIYAIGEVAQRQHPCVVTALADGVTAAKAIQARIEAGQ